MTKHMPVNPRSHHCSTAVSLRSIPLCIVTLSAVICLLLVTGLASSVFASGNDKLGMVDTIVGVDYGPFRDGQDPGKGIFPTFEQLEDDMPKLRKIADAIRTYSVTNGLENIIGLAEGYDLKVVPGAWLNDDVSANTKEVDNLIALANQYDNILFANVGSEAILRFENGWPQGLSKAQVIEAISRVRKSVAVPVTTAEPWHIWLDNPDLVDAVDLIFINVHPYWEQISIDEAVSYVFEKYSEVCEKYPEKRVVISETGWPSDGAANGPAQPSLANQKRFIEELLETTRNEAIDFLYFEAFNETWKVEEPNDVGPEWGFFSSDRTPKHSITSLNENNPPVVNATILIANFMNGNNEVFNSRVYLWNASASAGNVTVRVFTLPLRSGIAQELTGAPLDLGILEAKSALNLKLAEDILTPLGITTPYTGNGGNLTLEFTIEAATVRGVAQVFTDSFAFGTYPLQVIPSTSGGSPTILVANFMNGNDDVFNSRVYLWNPSPSAGSVTVRAYTLPSSGPSILLRTERKTSLLCSRLRRFMVGRIDGAVLTTIWRRI